MYMASNYTDTTDADFTTGDYNIDTGKNLSAAGVRNALHTKENVANKQVSSANDTADVLDASSSDDYYPSSKLAGKNFAALRSGKQDKIAVGTANDIVAYSGTTAGTFGTLPRVTTLAAATSASDVKIPTEKAVATALGSKEDSSNKATSITATNKDDAAKYPTIGAVTAWAENSGNKVTSITATNKDDAAKYPTTGAVAALVNTKEDSANKVTAITAASIEDTAKYPTVGAVTAWATTELMNILLPAGTILAMSTSGWAGADTAFKNKWKVCDG
ncbi:hypothetical protein NO1_2201, partial [Candidatus Termititenax aidoneus]